MSSESYDRINKSNVDPPNHSLSVLDSYLSESEKKLQVLSDIDNLQSGHNFARNSSNSDDSRLSSTPSPLNNSKQDSTDSAPNPGSPTHQSSPIKGNHIAPIVSFSLA